MSPIEDPSFAARRNEVLEQERLDAKRAQRSEYVKPLIMLVLGVGIVLLVRVFGNGLPMGFLVGLAYLVVLVVSLAFGVGGLWACCHLWLGGAGPLGLGILRLAAVYGMTDLAGVLTNSLSFMSWFIQAVVYIFMLAWLFELEVMESVIVAVVTFLLKVIVGVVLAVAIGTMLA